MALLQSLTSRRHWAWVLRA